MKTLEHLTTGLEDALRSPKERGEIELIVRRPQPREREVLEEGALDVDVGLVGDNWKTRGSRHTADGSSHPGMQLTIVNTRLIRLIAGDKTRWALAGDQIYADLDLSEANLPPGARVSLGSAIVEVTDVPHTGCKKFIEHYGRDALEFVSGEFAMRHRLRGVNARVIRAGCVRVGDFAAKITTRMPLE